jgi:hypothetical protein
MPSLWIVLAAVVAAINLRLIVPGVLAFFGIWRPSASPERTPQLTL